MPSPVLMVMAPGDGMNVDAFELRPEPLLMLITPAALPFPLALPFVTLMTLPESVESVESAVEGRCSTSESSMWSVCTYGASSFHESSSTRTGVGSTVPSSRKKRAVVTWMGSERERDVLISVITVCGRARRGGGIVNVTFEFDRPSWVPTKKKRGRDVRGEERERDGPYQTPW